MKKSHLLMIPMIALSVLVLSGDAFGQSASVGAGRAKQDQVIEDLLNEVHKLRVAMQQMAVNTYRGQIMVERLRLQQDQVARLTRDLGSVRTELAGIRNQQANFKERLEDASKQQEAGLISEQQLNELRAMGSVLTRREQSLNERESQASQELEKERLNLADLNQRLDELEREMVRTANVDSGKGNPKQ